MELRSLLPDLIDPLGKKPLGGKCLETRGDRYVIVVARTEPGTLEYLRSTFRGDDKVTVLTDRRREERRRFAQTLCPDRRRSDRRRSLQRAVGPGGLIVIREEAVAVEPRHHKGGMLMGEMEILDDRERVTRWLDESQYLMGRVIPGLLEDRERLRIKLEASEQESERLRVAVGVLQKEIADLQHELHSFRTGHAAVTEAFTGLMDVFGQLQKPLGEIHRRLQAVHSAEPSTAHA